MDIVRDPSLVLNVPLYECEGDTFASKEAYGHQCSVTGALWTPQGRKFDGSNDKITVAYNAITDLTTSGSIEVWVKSAEPGNYKGICGKENGGGIGAIALYRPNSDKVRFHVHDGSGDDWVDSLTDVFDGRWHHVISTIGEYKYIYVDGMFDISEVRIRTPRSGTDLYWRLANYGNSLYLNCIIGEFRLYNRALSQPEVQQNYLATKHRYR